MKLTRFSTSVLCRTQYWNMPLRDMAYVRESPTRLASRPSNNKEGKLYIIQKEGGRDGEGHAGKGRERESNKERRKEEKGLRYVLADRGTEMKATKLTNKLLTKSIRYPNHLQ